jgi:hypothetical protein
LAIDAEHRREALRAQSIAHSQIIKIAAVVFSTLVAPLYGMNFGWQ